MNAAEQDFDTLDIQGKLNVLMEGSHERRLVAHGMAHQIRNFDALRKRGVVVPESPEVREYRMRMAASAVAPAIGSAAFNYNDGLDADWPKYASVVAGRNSVLGNAKSYYQNLVDNGVIVAQYVNFTDIGSYQGGEFDRRFYPGGLATPHYNVTEFGSFYYADLSDPARRAAIVEAFKWAISVPSLNALFLDVFGERAYTNWGNLSAAQQKTFHDGMHDLADQFGYWRDKLRPEAFLIANGTWAQGHPALKACVEHHSTSEIPFWTTYGGLNWDKTGGWTLFIIAQGLADGLTWSKVPNVGLVAAQGTYDTMPSSTVSGTVTRIPLRSGVTPAPPPTPDPTPTPTPTPDPCADVKTQLASAQAALAAAQADAANLRTELTKANSQINGYREQVGQMSDQLTTLNQTLTQSQQNLGQAAIEIADLQESVGHLTQARDEAITATATVQAQFDAYRADVKTLLSIVIKDASAADGRLTTILDPANTLWKNLSASQRKSLTGALNRVGDITDKINLFHLDHS